ncbi:MAG: disulfide reductase [Candidatus Hecatellales archaeon B24]|nr:MAG: disulfide reductase [Candidatus Hecatellales archaeon B24]
MAEYAFFLGCLMPNRYPGTEVSTRKVFEKLGVKLVDMDGASCCPAPGVHGSFSLVAWATLAARNLTLAEELNADIVTCCNGCYATLLEANHLLKENAELRELVNGKLKTVGREFKGKIEVKHVVEVLLDPEIAGIEKIKDSVVKPLKGVKAAVHYGCHFLKPSERRSLHESVENPAVLDKLVEALGPTSTSYSTKIMCCGAGGGVRSGNRELTDSMTLDHVKAMRKAEADLIVTPCVFCQFQFDAGQTELEELREEERIPVLHITQLLALAQGFKPDELGIPSHKVPAVKLLEKLK